jgi:uncharacterized protein YaeQ
MLPPAKYTIFIKANYFLNLDNMALKSTIFKTNLNIADMDRPYYGQHQLILARHPSETNERLMVRVLAFALFANEHLEFGRGLSTEDDAALWLKDYTGDVRLWIEVGLPDPRVLRKACGRADSVVVLAYGGRQADIWWTNNAAALEKLDKLSVLALDSEQSMALASLASRGMDLQCTIQDNQIWLTDGENTVAIELRKLTK